MYASKQITTMVMFITIRSLFNDLSHSLVCHLLPSLSFESAIRAFVYISDQLISIRLNYRRVIKHVSEFT